MAHFAKIENNLVTQVIVVHNDVVGTQYPQSESIGQAFIVEHGYEGEWLQTSYNHNFRKQYGHIGFSYDRDADQFVSSQPYASWTLDTNNDWQAPTPKPEGNYEWNEHHLQWVQV
jgi:hypothetical protein